MAQITPALLDEFYTKGKAIRRASWPAGDHIMTDGAEGGTLWYYREEDDELFHDYRLGFSELISDDWVVLPCESA